MLWGFSDVSYRSLSWNALISPEGKIQLCMFVKLGSDEIAGENQDRLTDRLAEQLPKICFPRKVNTDFWPLSWIPLQPRMLLPSNRVSPFLLRECSRTFTEAMYVPMRLWANKMSHKLGYLNTLQKRQRILIKIGLENCLFCFEQKRGSTALVEQDTTEMWKEFGSSG